MIKYKHYWLAKTSLAFALYDSGEFDKLDKHLKQLELNYKELTK